MPRHVLSIRRRGAAILGTVGLASAVLLATPLPAAAGGPTSVLLASLQLQTTASLYSTDEDYRLLAESVGAHSFDSRPKASESPTGLAPSPGSDQINVTWLAHDVSIWRIDHVVIRHGGPWVLTHRLDANSGDLGAFDAPVGYGTALRTRTSCSTFLSGTGW